MQYNARAPPQSDALLMKLMENSLINYSSSSSFLLFLISPIPVMPMRAASPANTLWNPDIPVCGRVLYADSAFVRTV